MSTNAQPARPARRPVGRPRGVLLTRERILDEAFSLAADADVEFTLAALAKRLGVQPSAIHHHFAGKPDLIAAIRGELAIRIGDPGWGELPWYEAVVPWARAYRAAFADHPGVIAALAVLPVADEPESIADYERVASSFLRDGYPEHRIVPALLAIESFIIGSSLDELAPADNLRPARLAAEAPALSHTEQVAREFAETVGLSPAESAFEFGLTALIAGLRAAAAS